MLKEFKAFIAQGNVLDLAVAIVIGGAFGKIISSLVDDIIMPVVGILIGGKDFSKMVIQVGDATLKYGNFIQMVVQFLIIACVIFIIIKAANRAGFSEKKTDEKS
jgi:large conductance mechanosensitive channel